MARELTPGAVARTLFGIDPDRDERASQLCAETLLTLTQNGYADPGGAEQLQSPKRRQFAVRSLALGVNFLAGLEEGRIGADDQSPQAYGWNLAAGNDLLGSANLALARAALQGLIDSSTHQGQPGGWLLRPFHASLLWYDARRQRGRPWSVRQVYMRGSGVTLARMLCAPGSDAGEDAAQRGQRAVARIREALQSASPLGRIAEALERGLPEDLREPLPPEEPEKEAWRRGAEPQLAELAQHVCRHAEGVMLQGTASEPARLWQLRTVLALDLAVHTLRTAWDTLDLPAEERFLLLDFGGAPRPENRVRRLSERSFADARLRLRQATVSTLAKEMHRIAQEEHPGWLDELAPRGDKLDSVIDALRSVAQDANLAEFDRIARLATDEADYGRAAEGFRVLVETIGLLVGTGQYRYLSAPPDLLAALVGALSDEMPMTSLQFFAAVRDEWGLVIDQPAGTRLAGELDGADLQRSARRAERLLSDAGLAISLSDRTVMVGERAQRPAS